MNDLDDRPLERAPHDDTPGTATTRGNRSTIVVIALVGLLLGGLGAWWWARDRGPAATSPVSTAGTEDAISPTSPSAQPLPPLGQMDTFLRALLGALSSSPELARWLTTDDLIRQMANAIDRVSRGLSPATDVPVLQPVGMFETAGRPGQITIAPDSYRRYDGLATVVTSMDARAVADTYRMIQPRLDEAYRGLGRTEGSVDTAIAVALDLLIDTPIVDDPIALVPGKGATYAYADPALEALRPMQKQLLRMGPRNVALMQVRLREIKAAIETSRAR